MGIGEWGSVCGLVSLISLVSCSNSTAPATGDFTTALDLMVRDGPSGREAGSIDGAAALGDQMVERDLGGPSSCAPQGSKKILGTWDFGPTFNAVSSNGWLYVAAGGQVRIYDISTKAKLLDLGMTKIAGYPSGSDPRYGTFVFKAQPSRILHLGSFVEGMTIDGNYLYLIGSRSFGIADIANPAASAMISTLDLRGVDVKVKGNYAFVAADEYTPAGIHVVDISDKKHPILKKTIQVGTKNQAWRIAISGNTLYAALHHEPRLEIVDITSPLSPVFRGQLTSGVTTSYGYSGVAIVGHYAYVTEYHWGLRVVDVADPTKPQEVPPGFIGKAENDLNYSSVAIFGTKAYVSVRYGTVDIYDVSNPAAPVSGAKFMDESVAGYNESISVATLPYGTYALVATNTLGLAIVDVTAPAKPVLDLQLRTAPGGDAIGVKGHYAFIGGHNQGIWVVDVQDCRHPQEVALVSVGGRNAGVKVHGDYLYVTGGWAGFHALDISDPPRTKIAAFQVSSDGSAGTMVIAGNYLYTNNLFADNTGKKNFQIYDISSPGSPKLLKALDLGLGAGGFVSTTYSEGGKDYLLGGDGSGLSVIDISDRLAPTVVGHSTGFSLYQGDIECVGSMAYAANASSLRALDLSKGLASPVQVGSPIELKDPVPVNSASLVIRHSTAYALSGSLITAVDISTPASMKALGNVAKVNESLAWPFRLELAEANGLLYSDSGDIIDF